MNSREKSHCKKIRATVNLDFESEGTVYAAFCDATSKRHSADIRGKGNHIQKYLQTNLPVFSFFKIIKIGLSKGGLV